MGRLSPIFVRPGQLVCPLAELTLLGTYTYTMADMRATVAALDAGSFGDLEWVETRSLADGPQAFDDLSAGRVAAAKVVLLPASV